LKTKRHPTRRRARGGNALLEFVLTLIIIIPIAGLTMYMSSAMLTKQKALFACRRSLWRSAGHGHWTPMELEGTDPYDDEDADMEPDDTYRPRGEGEELDRLRPEVEPETLAKTSNAMAREYWFRIWDNLPGRHESEASRRFESTGQMWRRIPHTSHAQHKRDSSPWHFYHLDAWKIARAGPLKEIFGAFEKHLETEQFTEHFEPTRKDIIRRWFHGGDILRQEDQAN